jgi:hypothetical protein
MTATNTDGKMKTTILKESIGHTFLKSAAMPVNSKRALAELGEILERNGTNSFREFETRFNEADKLQAKAVIQFLMNQIYGELYFSDGFREYQKLNEQVDKILS